MVSVARRAHVFLFQRYCSFEFGFSYFQPSAGSSPGWFSYFFLSAARPEREVENSFSKIRPFAAVSSFSVRAAADNSPSFFFLSLVYRSFLGVAGFVGRLPSRAGGASWREGRLTGIFCRVKLYLLRKEINLF
jgi:hypothetical protein